MRIAVASTTMGSFFVSTAVPKSYLLALANSIAPKDFAEMYDPYKSARDEKSRRLRKKIKAKRELRKKLRSSGAYLTTLEEECDPDSMPHAGNLTEDVDLGILNCGNGEYCIRDSSSTTGGICAKVVYENSGVVRARGKTKYEDIGDWMVAGGKQLKMLTFRYQNKVQLEENKVGGAGRHSALVKEECHPGTNQGYVDIGNNGCQNSTHYCVEDSSSSLGGTCVHIDWDVNDSFASSDYEGIPCHYTNGTAGEKCKGYQACYESNKDAIGCGSCNEEEACKGMGNDTLIEDNSCNGEGTCRGIQGHTTIGKNSCNADDACKNLLGHTTIGNNSCNADDACMNSLGSDTLIEDNSCNGSGACLGIQGHTTIGKNSCNDDDACMNLLGTNTVGEYSCNSCDACGNMTDATVGNHACNGTNACYGLFNNSMISDHSCLGDGTCTMPLDGIQPYAALVVDSQSCYGCEACANINGLVSIGYGSCLGHSACAELSGNVTIDSNSCYGKEACSNSHALSTIVISDESCLGNKACKSMEGNVLVGSTACIGRRSCMENQGEIGLNSCLGNQACKQNKGDIGSDSCTDKKTCIMNKAKIGNCLCRKKMQCQNNEGTSLNRDGCSLPVDGLDIGDVGMAGSSTMMDNKISLVEVEGAGADIGGTSDSFHFFNKAANGDVSVEMFVKDFTGSGLHDWAKGGLMLRDSLNADAKHISLFVTGSNGLANLWRSNSGGESEIYNKKDLSGSRQLLEPPRPRTDDKRPWVSRQTRRPTPRPTPRPTHAFPIRDVWLKITKTGSTVQSYFKRKYDSTWTQFGSDKKLSFSGTFFYGIAVTSHDTSKTAKLSSSSFKMASMSPLNPPTSKSPTASPSNLPTSKSPSGSPSNSPRKSPSASPSNLPTSKSPSGSPSNSPSSSKLDPGALCVYEGDCKSGRCTNFQCAYSNGKLPKNSACIDSQQCESGWCNVSRCTDKLANGQICWTSTSCISGLCKFQCDWYSCGIKCSASLSDNALSTPSLDTGSCFPNARKVKLHLLDSVSDIQAFEFRVTSSGVNVAEGKAVSKSFVTDKTLEASSKVGRDLNTFSGINESVGLEIDLEQSYPIDSVSILGRWCMDSSDPDCLCKLSGVTLSLINDSGEEITSINIDDNACGKSMLEYVFDMAPEFCVPESVRIPSKQNVGSPQIQMRGKGENVPRPYVQSQRRLRDHPRQC